MEVASNVVASQGSSIRDIGSQRQSKVTDDEIRILGAHGRQRHPGAIGIPIPGSNRTAIASGKSGIPRGPQPKNTLSQANRPLANIPPSNSRGIQVKVIVGDNVAKYTKGFKESDSLEERPTKRRKTGTACQDQSSQAAGSDGVDELGWPEDVTRSLVRDNRRTSQTTSITSQGRERPTSYFGTQEFRHVEDTMNSNPNKRHKGKRHWHRSSAGDMTIKDTAILQEHKATSAADPIDLSDDEETKKPPSAATQQPRYRGTANEAHKKFLAHENSLRSLPVQDTGRTSRHFDKTVKANANRVSPVLDLPGNQPQQEVEVENDRLDNKFRATNGKPRSQDFASSPDVLSGDTTVGTTSRQVSPSKGSSSTRKGSPIKESQSGLPPSMYSNTAFSSATKKSKSTGQRTAQEASAPWGIGLAAVSVEDRMHRSTSLGLQHNPNLDAYDVIDGGNNWANQNKSFRVQPAKLWKVWWSLSGGMVRFESARSEGTDNTLDIELCSEKDMNALMSKIQEKDSFKVTGQEEDQIRKKFENRISQQRSQKMSKVSRTNTAVDEGEEIDLLIKRKAKRLAPQGMHALDKTDQKRQRVEPCMVDQLKGDAHATRALRVPWDNPRSGGGPPDKPLYVLSQDMNDYASPGLESSKLRSQSPSKITKILNNINAKPQATYSTRSKTEKALTTSRALPSPLDEPHPQRYSKTHDMGKEWTKPLTYPKTGKKRAIVEWTDLGRLDEGEFFNDTLIEFYLRYLQHQIETERPDLAKKIHFFNTFFYKNLTHKGKGQRRSNYELVERWTHGDEIFTKDYVVVPINEAFHWYVVIICNLPNLNRQPPSLDDETTSPLSDKIDPALRDDGEGRPIPPPSHSPSPEEAETSTDKETRASFAELSLEHSQAGPKGDREKIDASGGKATTDDQEMLDTQLNRDEDEAAPRTASTASKEKAHEDHSTLQNSAKKKGKRKSLPPARKLDPGQPAIITFDSLTGTHPTTIRVIKDYLLAEADAKRGGMKFDEKQIKGMTATGIPKQDNFCDCGPFLLGYMAKFLEDPQGFMSKAMQKQFDADKDWPTLVPSKLRSNIRELLFQLYREQEDEKRESAKKSGKYVPAVSRRIESSPTRAAPLPEPVQDPPAETVREPAKQVSRSTSPSPTTRRAALDIALPIDATEVPKPPTPGRKSPDILRKGSTLQKQHSVVVVDSQSQPHSRPPDSQSQPHSRPPDSSSPLAAAAPELPSTIQDSQPVVSFQALEDDIPATPPCGHYEGPPEPASSPVAPNGMSSPSRSPDVTRTLRSSPRSTRRSAHKREKSTREVVELD